MYNHAWTRTLGSIPRTRRIVVDPGAWGLDTAHPRDSVDRGTEYAPRFWNECGDVDRGQPRLAHYNDTIQYMDFKLYPSSQHCDSQWQLLSNWAQTPHETVLHTANEFYNIDYDLFRERFQSITYTAMHLDCTVRISDWSEINRAIESVELCFAPLDYLSWVINCVCDDRCYVYVIKHPDWRRGDTIIKSY